MSEREALQQLNLCRGRGIPQILGYDRGGNPIWPIGGGADGIYYEDLRQPFLIADQSAVTPTTTMKTCWAVGASSPTILPANYWTIGKTVKLTANLKLTTGAAGNSQFGMCYGAADAPAAVVATVSRAKIATVGPFGVFITGYATCRSIGTAGTLSMWGMVYADLSVFLSTVQPMVFPSNGVTVVSTIDTTVGTNALSFSYLTSAGTDSILATNILMEAMN
jgi:hypothetical protein